MDPDDIRELIELVSRSDFKCFELEREGFRLKLVRQDVAPSAPVPARESVTAVDVAAAPAAAPEPAAADAAKEDGLYELRSPIVGTFYRAPNPEDPPFLEVGTHVKKGQVACIVEAMKVMNEIESEVDGEVVEVVVANGQPVEFGDVLFRLRQVH